MMTAAPAPFAGMEVVLATAHPGGEDAAMGPVLADALGVRAVPVPLDGAGDEAPWAGTADPLAAARGRAALARAQRGGAPLVAACAGSLVEAAAYPGGVAACEHVLLSWLAPGGASLEVVGTWQTGNVARHQRRIRDLARLEEAAGALSFPSHGLVVYADSGADGGLTRVADGIVAWRPLREAVVQALDTAGCARLANDFRAHVNPTRHSAIAAAARELARRVAVRCPDCGAPGYGPVRVERGLPCGWCDAPTAGVRARVDGCALCGAERARPVAERTAPADTCSFCNPSLG